MLRDAFQGTLILNGGGDRDTAEAAVRTGATDAVSFSTQFLANSDLVRQYALGSAQN